MNLVTRDTDIAEWAKVKVAAHFPSLLIASAEDDVNEVREGEREGAGLRGFWS